MDGAFIAAIPSGKLHRKSLTIKLQADVLDRWSLFPYERPILDKTLAVNELIAGLLAADLAT